VGRIIVGRARPAGSPETLVEVCLAEAAALPALPQAGVDLLGLVAAPRGALPASALAIVESDDRLARATLDQAPGLRGLVEAWTVLGAEALVGLTLRAALLDAVWSLGDWHPAMAAAGAARLLARSAGVAPLLAYAAGALSRVGEALIARAARVAPFNPDARAVGAALLESWGLPRALVQSVARRDSPLARLVERAADRAPGAAAAEVLACEALLRPRA
jgi:hypothetical protein